MFTSKVMLVASLVVYVAISAFAYDQHKKQKDGDVKAVIANIAWIYSLAYLFLLMSV